MDNSFDKKKTKELVLYQNIVRLRNTSTHPVLFQKKSNSLAGTSLSPLELNPGVKQIFEKFQRQIFYHSGWWSGIHSDRGLIIDLLA